MTNSPEYIRKLLQQYSKQLKTARRLARYRRSLRLAGTGEDVRISRDAKRRQMVHRVTREIVDDLLVAGSENPIVQEIKQRLEKEFGYSFDFYYPPLDQDLQIHKIEDDRTSEVTGDEKGLILNRLWEIALETVDDTML